VRWLALVATLTVAGCAGKPKSPPKDKVQDIVRASVPPFLALESIDLEPIPTGQEEVKINFKATVTPKEDLYQVDRQVEGTPAVTLLKVVQTAGSEASLYGSLVARRTMDQWTIDPPQIEVGLRQFGSPRGAFDARSYLTGSTEANEALKEQAVNAEELARAKEAARAEQERELKARLERQALEEKAKRERRAIEERERLEREEKARVELEKKREEELAKRKLEEEQRKKELEAARQKILLATAPGTRYVGTLNRDRVLGGKETHGLCLLFTDQKGFLLTAEATCPDAPKEKQTFKGQVIDNLQLQKGSKAPYPIVMSPTGGRGFAATSSFLWFFRGSEGSIELRLTDDGLEGKTGGWQFGGHTIRLQRDSPKTSN